MPGLYMLYHRAVHCTLMIGQSIKITYNKNMDRRKRNYTNEEKRAHNSIACCTPSATCESPVEKEWHPSRPSGTLQRHLLTKWNIPEWIPACMLIAIQWVDLRLDKYSSGWRPFLRTLYVLKIFLDSWTIMRWIFYFVYLSRLKQDFAICLLTIKNFSDILYSPHNIQYTHSDMYIRVRVSDIKNETKSWGNTM